MTRRCEALWLQENLDRALAYFNTEYVLARDNDGRSWVYVRKNLQQMSLSGFKTWYNNVRFEGTSLAKLWLSEAKEYDGIIYKPGEPDVIDNYLNVWDANIDPVPNDKLVASLVEQITSMIKNDGDVTFARLARRWPAHFNREHLGYDLMMEDNNILLWGKMSKTGIDVARKLRELFERRPTSMFVYFIDGVTLNLPLAKQARNYKKLHWLPILFHEQKQPGRHHQRDGILSSRW